MSRPTVSFTKRQREQGKREKQAEKAAKRAQRKVEKANGPGDEIEFEVLTENVDTEAAEAPTSEQLPG
ncbi:MAG: hypothetical protein ACSLFQ_19890 [Thermoanaerobaculia bacterium]